jgi:hypothetical protein
MFLIKEGETNWKYLLIVTVIAVAAGAGFLWCVEKSNIKVPEDIIKDETADWKTYRNKEYGFEISYPSNYNISSDTQTDVGPALKADSYAQIIFRNFTYTRNEIELEKSKAEKVTVGSLDGYRSSIMGNMDGGIEFSVSFYDYPNTNNAFNVLFSTTKSGEEDEVNVFNQILSTFKFLEEPKETEIPESLRGKYSESIFKQLNDSMGANAETSQKMFEIYSPNKEKSVYIERIYDKNADAITKISLILENKNSGSKITLKESNLSKYSYELFLSKKYESAGDFAGQKWLLPETPISIPIKWINNEMFLVVKYDADEIIYTTIDAYNELGERYFSSGKISQLGLNYFVPYLSPGNVKNWNLVDVCEYNENKYIFITSAGVLEFIPSYIEFYPKENKYIQMIPKDSSYGAINLMCRDLSKETIKEKLQIK